jgi:hypoxanthine phosphoribosyltransferase
MDPAVSEAPATRPILKLSWGECHDLVELLSGALDGEVFDAVVGISRSGLIPAVMLSHLLGVRDFGVVDVVRTESDDHHSAKRAPHLRDVMNLRLLAGKRVLLVDDIAGAGQTLAAVKAMLVAIGSRVVSAVLVFNRGNHQPDGTPPDHHGCLVHQWVEFPWECKDLLPRQVRHA